VTLSAKEKRAAGTYVPQGQWNRMTDAQKAATAKHAINHVHGKMVAQAMRTGKPVQLARGVKFVPRPRKGAPKFKSTGNKGKNISSAAYQTLLKSGVRRKGTARRFTSGGNTNMVGHDFVGTLVISDGAQEADVVVSVSVNPVDLGFPALSVESQLHQQYLFRSFALHMVRSGTDFLTGDMLGWYDRDPDEELPPGIEGLQVGYYKGGTSAAFKDGHTWHMPKFPGLPVLYTRDLSSDERLVNQSQFNLQIINPPSVFNGSTAERVELEIELWASYDCQFMVKDITFAVGNPFPRNHIYFGDTADTPGTQWSSGPGQNNGIFLCSQSAAGSTTMNTVQVRGDAAAFHNPLGLSGFFFGFSSYYQNPVFGMLKGYGFNKATQFSLTWNSTKSCSLTCEGIDTTNTTFTNCSINLMGNQGVAPYVASSGRGSNIQQSWTYVINVTDPGEAQTPTWASDDQIYLVNEGSISVMPYDAAREFIWSVAVMCADTGTSTATIIGEVQRLDIMLEEMEGFGLLSPACKPGAATIEGMAKKKFADMDNKSKSEYGGRWQNYLKRVREKRRPPPKPLPDYLCDEKDEKKPMALALEDGKVRLAAPSPTESKDVLVPPARPAAPGPQPSGTEVVDIEDSVLVNPFKGRPEFAQSRKTPRVQSAK